MAIDKVDPVLAEGLAIADGIDAAGARALAELRFRRRGLAVSLVAILLLVVGLALKVRQIDRRQGRPAANRPAATQRYLSDAR